MPSPPTTQKDPIKIFYPNGGTEATQMYVWDELNQFFGMVKLH